MNSSTGSSSAVCPTDVSQRRRRAAGAVRHEKAVHRALPWTVHLGGSR